MAHDMSRYGVVVPASKAPNYRAPAKPKAQPATGANLGRLLRAAGVKGRAA